MHFVLQCAFDALDRWVRDGSAPPSAARLDADGDGRLVRDELGIACGGVRTPWVDAPTAVLSGLGQPGDMTELFGTTRPLDDARSPRAIREDATSTSNASARRRASRWPRAFCSRRTREEIEALGAAAS